MDFARGNNDGKKTRNCLRLCEIADAFLFLIGYESINKEALDNMKKEWSYKLGDIEESTRIIHKIQHWNLCHIRFWV